MNRYVHADCCERSFDNPLLYESGWKKKLTYVIGFSRHSVVDVTTRYSLRFEEVLSRRVYVSEAFANRQIKLLNEKMEQFHELLLLKEIHLSSTTSGQDRRFRLGTPEGSWGIPMEDVRERRRRNTRELEGVMFATVASKAGESVGRVSGDEAWKKARGEDGSS